jgi:hypothetical protein
MPLRERLAEADDDAGNAAVADDHVRAEAERYDRHLRIEPAEEGDEVFLVRWLEQPLRIATGLEPDERGERGALFQLSSHAVDPERSQRTRVSAFGSNGFR